MRNRRGFLLALLIFSSSAYAYGADQVNPGFTFPDSGAGVKVEIPGTFTDEGVRHVLLVDTLKPDATPSVLAAAVSGESKNILSFVLPSALPDGRYLVKIQLGDAAPVSVGELRVPKAAEAKVTVETAEPISYYPDAKDQYGFVIAGTNFAGTPENNHVEINKVPLALVRCSDANVKPCIRSQPGSETTVLFVEGFAPTGYSKPLLVSVRVGTGNNVSAQMPLTFSRWSKTTLKLVATAAFVGLLLILYFLVRAGIKLGKINGEKYGSLRAFLLDKETNSYSLSKFQLTLFTLVTVFGYIYVFVCRLLVQWKLELPPVPEGLPGMMAVSLGTTVVAAGIGSQIGGKGAGPTSPSLGDFITSGGVVLPERFQFFLWTIVSSVGVLVLILASDPVTVTELPKLPDGMLYLMGLSSAGYLGGKLVRGPGPSIRSIDAAKILIPGVAPDPDVTALEVTLTGDNLAVDATFQLDDERIPADQVNIVDKTPESRDPKLCSMLKVQLKNVAERYFDKSHLLRIVNPDSQGADVNYGATVESISSIKAGDQPVQVTVKGANFKDPSEAVWTDAAGAVTPVPAANITKKSDTELEISLTPGIAGKANLAIKSPGSLTTTVDVTVAE